MINGLKFITRETATTRRNSYNRLRNNRYFNIPNCKTKRFKNSFMIASASRV